MQCIFLCIHFILRLCTCFWVQYQRRKAPKNWFILRSKFVTAFNLSFFSSITAYAFRLFRLHTYLNSMAISVSETTQVLDPRIGVWETLKIYRSILRDMFVLIFCVVWPCQSRCFGDSCYHNGDPCNVCVSSQREKTCFWSVLNGFVMGFLWKRWRCASWIKS